VVSHEGNVKYRNVEIQGFWYKTFLPNQLSPWKNMIALCLSSHHCNNLKVSTDFDYRRISYEKYWSLNLINLLFSKSIALFLNYSFMFQNVSCTCLPLIEKLTIFKTFSKTNKKILITKYFGNREWYFKDNSNIMFEGLHTDFDKLQNFQLLITRLPKVGLWAWLHSVPIFTRNHSEVVISSNAVSEDYFALR